MQETSTSPPISLANVNADSTLTSLEPVPKARSSKSATRGRTTSVAWFLKPTFVALALVVVGVLTVGWGAYSVVARPSSESDEAELADLEGFDLESPSLGQSQPTDDAPAPRLGDSLSRQQSSLPITERAPQLPSPPPAGSFELPPQSSLPSFQSARYERDPAGRDAGLETNSGAWLSGAIEASEDVPSRILLPSRISQAVVDGPAIR